MVMDCLTLSMVIGMDIIDYSFRQLTLLVAFASSIKHPPKWQYQLEFARSLLPIGTTMAMRRSSGTTFQVTTNCFASCPLTLLGHRSILAMHWRAMDMAQVLA